MPLDFPSNPTNGQVYDNYYWDNAAGVWNSLGNYAIPNLLSNATFTSSGSSIVPVTVRGAASQAANLQEWKNNSNTTLASISASGGLTLNNALTVGNGGTGTTSLTSGAYLKGAGTSAITAQTGIPAGDITSGSLDIARGGTGVSNGVGLVPIIPTSITKVGAGTPTVSSSGLITFDNISDIQPNGVFSSSYRNYKVIVQFTNSTTTEFRQRYSASGTARTDALYGWGGVLNNSNGVVSYYAGINIDWGAGGAVQAATSQAITIDVINPASSTQTTRQNAHFSGWNGVFVNATFGMAFNSNIAVDGLRIYVLAGTMAGTMQVFGYRQEA